DQEQHGHEGEHERAPADRHELEPAEPVAEREGERDARDDDPAERRDDVAQPPRDARDGPPDRPRGAHGTDHGIRERTRAGADDAGPCGAEPRRVGGGGRLAPAPRRAGGAHTACRSLGGGVSSSSWAMTLEAVTPSNSASGSSTRRCASTGSASDL